ncbi:MAG: hypothetical protein GYA66_12745, partial [Phyllobacteriaceae bacterium]|nr:hypothetical protein [Phyllobacteriaceae bacterium]
MHALRARFVGTDGFAESFSDAVSHEVTDPTGVDTEVTLFASKTTASIGETVMLTVAVTAATGTPDGKVTLTQQGISVIGDFPLVNGVAEIPFSSSNLGSYIITAEYAAMPGFKAATGQVVMTFGKAPSELLMTSSKNPANLNEPVTFIVTPVNAVTRAKLGFGRVHFYDGNVLLTGGRGVPTSTSATNPAILGTVRFTIPNTLVQALSVGTHQIRAVYAETDFILGSEATFTQTIVAPEKPTTTTLSTSKSPATVGESVTFSASVVTSDTGAKATGNVEFYNGPTLLGSAVLADGVASISTSFTDVDELEITARYLGEANAFAASTSATLTQRIDKFGTSVSLTSTPNPSQQGQEVSLTATVTSAAATPAGTVEFFDGAVSLGTSTLSGGSAVLTTSALEAGSHDLTAVYSGSANEAASASAVLSHGVGTESAEIDMVQQQASQAAAGASTDVITDITSEVISDALSGQVQVLSASDGKVGLTWAPGLKRGGTMIVPTADALPTTESSWRFWVKGRYTDWDAGSLDGQLWNGMAGASLLFGDGMVAGLVAGYESYDYEDTVGATLKGDGLSLGGYVGGKLTDSLTFDTQLHSAFIDYDVASGGISGDFDATRLIAAGGFSYALHDGALSFTPSLRANAMWEWQDGYIDTAAVAHGARGFGNARVSGGARVAYTIPLSEGGRFIPYISGYGDWRVSDGDQTIDSVLDGVSGRIESGFDLQTRGGINF